jgi:hypothetical protein
VTVSSATRVLRVHRVRELGIAAGVVEVLLEHRPDRLGIHADSLAGLYGSK